MVVQVGLHSLEGLVPHFSGITASAQDGMQSGFFVTGASGAGSINLEVPLLQFHAYTTFTGGVFGDPSASGFREAAHVGFSG